VPFKFPSRAVAHSVQATTRNRSMNAPAPNLLEHMPPTPNEAGCMNDRQFQEQFRGSSSHLGTYSTTTAQDSEPHVDSRSPNPSARSSCFPGCCACAPRPTHAGVVMVNQATSSPGSYLSNDGVIKQAQLTNMNRDFHCILQNSPGSADPGERL
jgi:hypothetical protein